MAPQKYYTVGVSNKFAAFGSDSDASEDGEVILSAPPPAPAEHSTTPLQQSPGARRREQQISGVSPLSPQREQRGPRPPRGGARGGFAGSEGRGGGFRGRRVPRDGSAGNGFVAGGEGLADGQQQSLEGDGAALDVPRFRRGGGGFRGRGRGRGGGGVGRREFDRQSGNGRGREMKKGGAGGHNWGVEENGEQSGTAAAPPATALQQNQQNPQETRQEGEDGANANASEEVASPEVAEPEEDVIDWETYKKQQAEKRMHLPTFVASSASALKVTTEADLQAAGYVKLARGEEESDEENEEEEGAQTTREDRPKKKSVNLFEFVHNEGGRIDLLRRRDDDRGGRGRRGGRGGGGGSSAPQQRRPPAARDAPDLYDQRAFPTLGGQA